MGRRRISEPNGQFSIALGVSVVQRLDRLAVRRGNSRGGVIREAVLDWLERQPPEPVAAPHPSALTVAPAEIRT